MVKQERVLVCSFDLRGGEESLAQRRKVRRGSAEKRTQEHSQEWLWHREKRNLRGRFKAAPMRLNSLGAQAEACATGVGRLGVGFEEFAEGGGGVFAEFAVVGAEGG